MAKVDPGHRRETAVKVGVRLVRLVPMARQNWAYVNVQISLDGATAEVNDEVRGPDFLAMAIRALGNLAEAPAIPHFNPLT
jgi:hypothetical protein